MDKFGEHSLNRNDKVRIIFPDKITIKGEIGIYLGKTNDNIPKFKVNRKTVLGNQIFWLPLEQALQIENEIENTRKK